MQKVKASASAKGTPSSTLINNSFKERGRERAALSVGKMPQPTTAWVLFADGNVKLGRKLPGLSGTLS
eukprot:34717-Pyramimonas_sp.AAC.1